jgi:hypothetical protein
MRAALMAGNRSQAKQIGSFDELQAVLGDKFVLFCGSAVSGTPYEASSRFLPMVSDVFHLIFGTLSSHLARGNYYNRLLANYASMYLDTSGRYYNIQQETKFETLLSHLESVLDSKEEVNSFLRALFYCEEGQSNYNHAAIASLLRDKRAIACITTNFDNAIECAYPAISPPFVHPQFPDKNTFVASPGLIKLHGDVVKGTYIATTEEMLRADAYEAHSYIRDLLDGLPTLFMGYSATGDVDIAPFLAYLHRTGSHTTKLIWIVKPGIAPPSFATHYFVSDLWTDRIDGEYGSYNCLLRLAYPNTTDMPPGLGAPNWYERGTKWIENVGIEKIQNIILSVFSGRDLWVPLHLFHIRKQQRQQPREVDDPLEDQIYHFVACVKAGIYLSGNRLIAKTWKQITEEDHKLTCFYWRAFSNWRLRRLNKALEDYEAAIETLTRLGRDNDYEQKIKTDDTRIYYDNLICRYLEVARDKLYIIPLKSTLSEFLHSHKIDERIKSLQVKAEVIVPGHYLNALVVRNIELILGKNIESEEIAGIYAKCHDLKEFGLAAAAARLLVQIDLTNGIDAIRQINAEMKKRKLQNLILQNSLAVIHARLFHLRILYVVIELGVAILAWLKALTMEFRYWAKLRQWNKRLKEDKA